MDTAYEARASAVRNEIDRQSARDQGLMFGYACSDANGTLPYLRPDSKTQVTVEHAGERPGRLHTVVVSSRHAADIDLGGMLAGDIREHVIEPEIRDIGQDTESVRLLVDPTGRFVIGGPRGAAGLTGRKIVVDSYGGTARHGGGAFPGKEP